MNVLTYNLSALAGTAMMAAGVFMVAGAGWALVAGGGLVLAMTVFGALMVRV